MNTNKFTLQYLKDNKNTVETELCNLSWWDKFKVKRALINELPSYHKDTGGYLPWKVRIDYHDAGYNENTGKPVQGKPFLYIDQKYPGGIRVDNNCYKYNWKEGKVERKRCQQWTSWDA
jgi:hypothetical protein